MKHFAWLLLVNAAVMLAARSVAAAEAPTSLPSTRPATQPAAPQADREAGEVLDAVLRAWLAGQTGERIPKEPPRVVLLLGANLPADYEPHVEGWTILRVVEKDGTAPPSSVIDGDIGYQFNHRSSYSAAERLPQRVVRNGQNAEPGGLREVTIDGPLVLRIDKVKINGGAGMVKISQNLHHNMGATGTTYKVERSEKGWECHAGLIWAS